MIKAPRVRKSSSKETLRDMPLPLTEEPEISYKRLFEASQDGIFVLDVNTSSNCGRASRHLSSDRVVEIPLDCGKP